MLAKIIFSLLFIFSEIGCQVFRPTVSPQRTAGMTDYDKVGRVPTLNKMGWMHPVIDDVTQQFLDLCQKNPSINVIEIGAAYGYASKAALEKGANVWVNDLDARHLADFDTRAHIVPGNFPYAVELPSQHFDALLSIRVLGFMRPDHLKAAIKEMYKLLKPNGKIYIVADSPYLKNWQKFIPVYEERKSINKHFPGYISKDIAQYNLQNASHLPDYFNFLDPLVLSREFEKQGFEIEWCDFMNRTDYPERMRFNGRESVGLIARKKKDI